MSEIVETVESVLKVEEREGVALLTLNRPHRLNALSGMMMEALIGTLDRVENDDDIRVIVITGGPRADGRPCFCAGADLHELAKGGAGSVGERDFDLVREVTGTFEGDHLGTSGFRLFMTRLENFPKPIIAAIDGVCTAGGIEMALSCDIRIASETAQISDLHMKTMNHSGGAGATSRLARLVGPAVTKEMIFLGLVLNGQDALARGLVNRVAPPLELVDLALQMAQEIAKRHPVALRVGKAVANASVDLTREQSLRYDYLCWTTQMMTTGGYEGAKAFTAKSKSGH
jgi:enoyl-CoA hydratase/carnithine racemase